MTDRRDLFAAGARMEGRANYLADIPGELAKEGIGLTKEQCVLINEKVNEYEKESEHYHQMALKTKRKKA